METATGSVRKRTGWIWAICLFYLISAGWTILATALVYSGSAPLNAAQRAYFASLSSFDIGFSILLGSLNLLGALMLFILNRMAFNLFATAFGISLLLTFWHAATKGWLQAIGATGIVGYLLGVSLSAAICFYSWKLIKRGTLV
jgi:hypothetical protein